ncbi:MAG: hypothetical protein Q4F00_08640, partial [bacterium]|nr:hypothetical protein [bacterium]
MAFFPSFAHLYEEAGYGKANKPKDEPSVEEKNSPPSAKKEKMGSKKKPRNRALLVAKPGAPVSSVAKPGAP